jgi:ferrochelatase
MYTCSTKYESFQDEKIGILVTNLGTPDSPDKKSLKRYLKEFLSDPRVVEPPPARWIWKLILNAIILNTRPKRSSRAYKSVWGRFGKGSPLLDISIQQKELIQQYLNEKFNNIYEVELGMRYGNPSIKSALEKLEKLGCNKILVFPLYPQYAASTTGSTFDAVADTFKSYRKVPEIRFINSYHEDEGYIQALANSVKGFQKINGKPDVLLMSYHGIPRRYFDNGDSYPCNCCKTTYLLSKKLNLKVNDYKMSYQSRVGRDEWIKDYTDKTLINFPSNGVKSVQVICPGFSADCLETIEEIEEENKGYFLESGGVEYKYIPALNYHKDHIGCLANIIIEKTSDWIKK